MVDAMVDDWRKVTTWGFSNLGREPVHGKHMQGYLQEFETVRGPMHVIFLVPFYMSKCDSSQKTEVPRFIVNTGREVQR